MRRGGKYSKPTRGGGKKFSRDLKPLDDTPGMWDDPGQESNEGSSEEEEDSGEESEDGSKPSTSGKPVSAETAEMTREERKAAQKAAKAAKIAKLNKATAGLSISEDEEEVEEQEEAAAKGKQAKVPAQGFMTSNLNAGGPVETGLTRKEREAVEAAAAKERYRKLHEAGKTDEAKSDLARLAIIRQEREEKARQRQAELDEKKRVAEVKALASGKRK